MIRSLIAFGIVAMLLAAQTSSFEVQEATIADIHAALQARRLTCVQLVQKYLDRIAAYDKKGPAINAIITINSNALVDARAMDAEIAQGGLTKPLQCIPIVVKDNFETMGLPTTAGSLSLAGWISDRDAFQVKKIREAGAIILAKTNMAEFAWSPVETVGSMLPGYTRNPYALNRVTAGSSGGTAAAVAANFAAVGLGTDTGNSIRGPSSHNDLVGIRSTMGLASRSGIVPLNLMNDIAGPMARTVTDAVKVLDVVAGYDSADAVTEAARTRKDASYSAALVAGGLKGARIGIARFIMRSTVDPDVVKLFDEALAVMQRNGAVLVDNFMIPGFDAVQNPTGCGILERFKFGLNDYLASRDPAPPVKDLAQILASRRFHPSIEVRMRNAEMSQVRPTDDAVCRQAQQKRGDAVISAMEQANVSAVVYPTWDNVPRLIGDLNTPAGDNSQSLSPGTGFPAITVPMGFVRGEFPSGMTFFGRGWSESTLIKLAYSYEQAANHRRAPASAPPLK
ncbi:MAG TPA: amidase family protein [Terriglobia bacterium]|nr:amidase family protein [Terriglobia bacterium]